MTDSPCAYCGGNHGSVLCPTIKVVEYALHPASGEPFVSRIEFHSDLSAVRVRDSNDPGRRGFDPRGPNPAK